MFSHYNSVYDYILPITISTLAWKLLYVGIGKFTPESIISKHFKKYETAKEQVVSLAASMTTLTLAGICHVPAIVSSFPNLSSLFGQELDEMAKLLHVVLAGYFIHDTIWCIQNKYHDPANYIHHAISIGMLVAGLEYNDCLYETIWPLWASELSTVPLNLRFFYKMKYNTNSEVLDHAFAGLFFVGRICGGTWCIWHFCKTPGPMWIRYIGVSALFLNYFWFYKIMEKTGPSKRAEREKSDRD